jgi:hypothetical protein
MKPESERGKIAPVIEEQPLSFAKDRERFLQECVELYRAQGPEALVQKKRLSGSDECSQVLAVNLSRNSTEPELLAYRSRLLRRSNSLPSDRPRCKPTQGNLIQSDRLPRS